MKQLFYSVVGVALSFAGITACKNKLVEPPGISLYETIRQNSKDTLFRLALDLTGYGTLLSTSPSVTALVPPDTAFESTGYTAAVLKSMNSDALKVLIGYHLIGQTVPPAKLPAAGRLETRSGYYLYTTNNNGLLYLNDVAIQAGYIPAANGILIPVSKVLKPPTERLYVTLAADTTFSLYTKALTRDSVRRKLFKDTFNTGNLFTVFAPTNNAFRRAGISERYIDTSGYDTISRLVMRHYIANAGLTYGDFVNNTALKSAGDSTLILITSASTRFGQQAPAIRAVNRPDTTLYRLKTRDQMTANGILHSIDSLLPPRR